MPTFQNTRDRQEVPANFNLTRYNLELKYKA